MIFQWLNGVWQLSSSYRGKSFKINLVRLRTKSQFFVAKITVDGKQIGLSILPDTDLNNVGREARDAVISYIDTHFQFQTT